MHTLQAFTKQGTLHGTASGTIEDVFNIIATHREIGVKLNYYIYPEYSVTYDYIIDRDFGLSISELIAGYKRTFNLAR